MFEYFRQNYTWNLALMSALNRGGAIGEIDEACRSLQEASVRNDVFAQQAWYETAVNSPNRKLKVFTLAEGGAEHCQADNMAMVVDYMADWVAEILGGDPKGL